jgi:hypothetical protein
LNVKISKPPKVNIVNPDHKRRVPIDEPSSDSEKSNSNSKEPEQQQE